MQSASMRSADAAPKRAAPTDLMNSAEVRAAIGGISEMSLWRWTRELAFPKPDVIIQRRKFWRRATIERWLKRMAKTSTPASAPRRATA